MTKTNAVKKKPTKKVIVPTEEDILTRWVTSGRMGTIPLLEEAIILAVDNQHEWGKPGRVSEGKVMESLPKYARIAAILFTMGPNCGKCGKPQEPRSPERALNLHPHYQLCDCFMPLRNKTHDYIPNWSTAEGLRTLAEDVEAGRISRDAPLYQFKCSGCKKGPLVYPVRSVYATYKKTGTYSRRRLCEACYVVKKTTLTVPLGLAASKGREANIKKFKKPRPVASKVIDPVPVLITAPEPTA